MFWEDFSTMYAVIRDTVRTESRSKIFQNIWFYQKWKTILPKKGDFSPLNMESTMYALLTSINNGLVYTITIFYLKIAFIWKTMKIPLCTFIRNTVRTDSMIEIPLCTFIQDCTIIRDTRVVTGFSSAGLAAYSTPNATSLEKPLNENQISWFSVPNKRT